MWLSILGGSACTGDGATTVIKLAHGLDVTHPVHRRWCGWPRSSAEDSNGSVRIDIYPSEQLGSERECVELLQIGSIGMTKVSTGPAEAFIPSFKVFSLPYVFRDREHLFAVLEGEVGRDLLLEGPKFEVAGPVLLRRRQPVFLHPRYTGSHAGRSGRPEDPHPGERHSDADGACVGRVGDTDLVG